MVSTSRLPQAPSEPLAELDAFLKPLHVHFVRSESRHAMERYLTGLLTEHPNKNCDTLAQVVPDTSEQSLQGLLTSMRWDEQALNNQRVAGLHALKTEGDGVLIIDDMGFPKQGKDSVGVARQYSGALGKVDNCQVTVNLTYAGARAMVKLSRSARRNHLVLDLLEGGDRRVLDATVLFCGMI